MRDEWIFEDNVCKIFKDCFRVPDPCTRVIAWADACRDACVYACTDAFIDACMDSFGDACMDTHVIASSSFTLILASVLA